MPPKLTMPAGAQYGRLTVIEEAPRAGAGPSSSCRCACGAIVTVRNNFLVWGRTLSCGCLRRETSGKVGERNRTHGRTQTPEYRAWHGARGRCRNPTDRQYAYYGGRGITVCAEWDDFEVFFRDMGPKPSPRHSLDRIDNDGPYAPWSCRWATATEQLRNRRTTVRLTHEGQSLTLVQWSAVTGIPYTVLKDRVRYGWSAERALSQPVQSWVRGGPRSRHPHD